MHMSVPERASQREKSHNLELFSLEVIENRVILTDTGNRRGPGFQGTGRTKRRKEEIMS